MIGVFLLLVTMLSAQPRVTARFDPTLQEVGPFPTDFLTVPDASQKTGLRINLRLPEGDLLNQLDGFNPLPRISVRFSSRINADTLRAGVFLMALDNLSDEEYGLQRAGDVIPINQVIYDPVTFTAYAKPDSFMDQHRRYALVVTDAVRDALGAPVVAEPGFSACIEGRLVNDYCRKLAQAVAAAAPRFTPAHIVDASIFTTLSATVWLDKARAQLQNMPLGVTLGRVFRFSELASFTWRRQVGANPLKFEDLTLPVELLPGVDRIAFASYRSPNYLNERQLIPATPTGADVALPPASTEIFFHALLPPTPKPPAGYPVVIFGHGITDNRFVGPSAMATVLNGAGFAVVAINAVGHGSGPDSKVIVRDRSGNTVEIPAPGRGVDQNGDGVIESSEGCIVSSPPVGLRDCLRQTVVDLMQLVRAIRAGVPDLDPARIYYVGQSLGAIYGTILNAVEPDIPAAVLNVGGGSIVDIARWSPSAEFRNWAADFVGSADFNDNYVLRYRPAKVNDVPGAIELQNLLERLEWLQASGDPLSYAPHLASSTLPGVPIKRILWTFAKGDRTVPNPASTALIRAANMRESTWFYRHDLARAVLPQLPENPHIYMLNLLSLPALPIAFAAQQQAAGFLAQDGLLIPDPNAQLRSVFGRDIFEMPAFLTEDLNY